MKNKKEVGVQGGKKPYVKPEVRKVILKPEEAVLGACKTTSKSGPVTSSGCQPSGIKCSILGS
jgi:hypothetical protein